MKTLRILAVSAMVGVALLLGIQSTSHALTLWFNDFTNPIFSVVDGSPQDSNGVTGAVTFNGAIGTWVVNVTTGVSKPVFGSAADPQLDLNSVNVTSAVGGHLRFGVVDSGFTGPLSAGVAGPFDFNVGGTTQGVIFFDIFGDATNAENFGGATFATSGPFFPVAFSGTASGTFAAGPGPFSLGIIADVTHTGNVSTSFDAALQGGKVPEPMSLILLGGGLAGVGLYRRLRKPRG
jgi:hypothetical protein